MSVQLNQLDDLLACLEYIINNPRGPYRPARVARALGLSDTRVRRWFALLVKRNWLRRVRCDYFQSETFSDWGRAVVGQLIQKGG